jgi:hypothetical protein
MNRFFVIIVLITLPFMQGWSQTDREKVEAAIRNYVDAFYEADTFKIHRSIAKDVVKYGYAIPKNKTEYERFPDSFDEMIGSIIKYGKFPNRTPYQVEVFDVLDQTASAKVTAGWGIDYMLLAKQNGNWMITHVLWQTAPPKK